MRTFDEDLDAVKALQHGGDTTIAYFQDGGGKVYRVRDVLVLFGVPMYGGRPRYIATYPYQEYEKVVTEAHSWT